jgi:phosphoenolpyruvate carboxylase
MKLDIRQESSRHTEAMDEITKAIEAGSYAEWDEQKRLDFLLKELQNKRPVVPYKFKVGYLIKMIQIPFTHCIYINYLFDKNMLII